MKSWVLCAVGGMLSIAGTGCATAPAGAADASSSLPPSLSTPKAVPAPAATRPAARATPRSQSALVAKPHTASRLVPAPPAKPPTKPVVTAAPAPTRPSAEFWDGQGKCEGIASFYAGKFIGRKTANGERYTGRKLTAAHRVLPFGTFVKVTRLDNGLSVIVRINDRGPYIDGRVIDLSPAAAKRIHLIKTGVTHVRLEVVAPWMAEE